MSSRWYAARIKSTLSWDVIIGELDKQGFTSYHPVITKSTYFAGRKLTGEWPLFPSYLFTSFDMEEQRWRAINSTHGVMHLLPTNSEFPQALPIGFVEELRSRRTVEKMVEVAKSFEANAIVRVLVGALKGQDGRVIDSNHKLTRVEISAFSRKVRATIPTGDLAPAPRSG
jgi:transcriptional antiterminator RfaH